MNETELARRVQLVRLCLHARKHYRDENGNLRCFGCDAFVRPNAHVPVGGQPQNGV